MSSDLESGLGDAISSDDRAGGEYIVVARRYRPKSFTELVGQQQVAQALRNAIQTNRVGHAYLFTGARGVGKTSTARIFAKCLNCVEGPTATPCGRCDSCVSVAQGEDVDVLEIDGASNRGIDEIRELRSNVNVRPSRSRFKVYIIDEVHMLTPQAFNALLKTLEEPPEHVKFVFCTTDPEKIPITVLSRCQRFDFAPVATDSIKERLRHIVDAEGVDAEDAALQLLARRAGGSMRDSQSLLEQLLSFCGSRITEQDVHALLGTAQSGRLATLARHLIDRNAAAALAELDVSVSEGVDIGQLAEQLLGYLRDMMTAVVGCPADVLLHAATSDHAQLVEAGREFGLETLLAAAQILDQAIGRMRQSTQVRTLVEMALVRICHLEQLDDLSALIAGLHPGTSAPSAPAARRGPPPPPPMRPDQKKKEPLSDRSADSPIPPQHRSPQPPSPVPPQAEQRADEWNASAAEDMWRRAVDQIGGMTADIAGDYESLAIPAPNSLVVGLKAAYNKDWCERADVKRKLEQTLAALAGRPIRIDFAVTGGPAARPLERRAPSQQHRAQKLREVEQHPLIQEAMELFGAEILGVQGPNEG